MPRIGIPYAYEYVDENSGQLYCVCPFCKDRIYENTDRDGEKTTSNYAQHYAEAHDPGELADPSRTSIELKLNGEYVYVNVVRWSPDGSKVEVVLPSGVPDTFPVEDIVG